MADKQTWENDNGLVIRREPDGSVSFDIFDADEWNGGIEEGRTIAALIVRAVNHHEELVEALGEAETWLMRVSGELLDGEGSRPAYAATCEKVRTLLAKVKEAGHG